jgi:diguanylate cyclase (GGDEF)-like protein
MLEMLHTERSRAERSGHPWSICMIDLDLFKQVNDHHGHNVGDEVLASVAQVIREGLRDSDQVARWGGEEFLILFPSTDAAEAKIVLERIRLALRSTGVSRSLPELKVTFSAGVAACQSGDSLPVSIDRADRALYLAKASGRNRTEVAIPVSPSAPEPMLAVR